MKIHQTILVLIIVSLLTLPCGAAAFNYKDINIHGFVSQGFFQTTKEMGYLARDAEDGTFDFNEMAVNFSINPSDNLRMGIQLNAFDMGGIGNDRLDVDWAYGDYSISDYLNVQAGIMKIPFGLYNDVRKVDMVRTSILLPSSVYPEWFREAFARIKGVSLSGTLPGNISYQAMYGTLNLKKNGGLADAFASLFGSAFGASLSTDDVETNFAYAGRLQWDSTFGLKLAASHYTFDGMKMNLGTIIDLPAMITGGLAGLTSPLNIDLVFEPLEMSVLSAEYMTDRLTLAAEYIEYDLEFLATFRSNLDPAILAAIGIPPQFGYKTTMQGFYGSMAYRLLDQLEVGTYYSELYFDKSDHSGQEYAQAFNLQAEYEAWLKDWCLSLRYDFSPNWCAKVEGHFMDGIFLTYGGSARNWALYAAKVTYSF